MHVCSLLFNLTYREICLFPAADKSASWVFCAGCSRMDTVSVFMVVMEQQCCSLMHLWHTHWIWKEMHSLLVLYWKEGKTIDRLLYSWLTITSALFVRIFSGRRWQWDPWPALLYVAADRLWIKSVFYLINKSVMRRIKMRYIPCTLTLHTFWFEDCWH